MSGGRDAVRKEENNGLRPRRGTRVSRREEDKTIEEFCVLADQAVANSAFFDEPGGGDQGFERQGEWLKFPSEMSTDVEENNVVWARITDSGSSDRVLVIFTIGMQAPGSPDCQLFSKRGITVVEIAMPYHFERSRPGSPARRLYA